MRKNTMISCMSFLTIFALATSCTKEEVSETETLVSQNESLSTSGGSCGSTVNFKDLIVETSWISGDTGDRDSFGACGVDGEPWMDKYSDGRVMMKCLADDSHRTELKEDTGDEDGLGTYKKMKFIAKFHSIPENGVTIAQIHNRHSSVKRPWIRLYIDDDRKIRIKETETTPNGSSSTYTTYTGETYTSGAEITVNVWTGLSGHKKGKINVQTNGTSWTKTLWPSSAWNSYSNDYYLKAGVYTEGNDTQAKVIYSYFLINH